MHEHDGLQRTRWLVGLAIILLVACSDTKPAGPDTCTQDSDCPDGGRCENGVCYATCTTSAECPGDQVCISGTCRTACQSDADCSDLEVCENGYCVPKVDEDGGIDGGADGQADAGQDGDTDMVDAGGDPSGDQVDDGADAGGDAGDQQTGCVTDDDCLGSQVCQNGLCICLPEDSCGGGGDCCPNVLECVDQICRPPCDGVRCGRRQEICCEPGLVCEDERCMIDCDPEKRCGENLDVCCAAEEICYAMSCTITPNDCAHPSDCPDGYICDPDLGICIEEQLLGDCLYHPPVGQFDPEIECRWTPPADQVTPQKDDVVMAPVVANLTDDNGDGVTDTFDIPDIAFISYDLSVSCCNVPGTLRIVSGRCNPDGTMTTLASIADPPLDNSGGLAVGDLDGDGVPEIVGILHPVTVNQPHGTVAFKRVADDGSAWEVMWSNPDYPAWNVHTRGGSQPSLANLAGDEVPEVIIGNVVLNGNDGSLRWDGLDTVSASAGIGNNAFLGPVSTVADLDLDGEMEVLAGNTCYYADGSEKWTFTYTSNNSPCGGNLPCDGFNAAGNFDSDPEGEAVIIRRGEVFVLEHNGDLLQKVAIPTDDCANNESGPPTVADFDNDGRAEIGTAAADYYVIVDLDCLEQPMPPECAAPGVLWYVPNQDCSSRVTASSVFDFDGDGQAEAIYADETTFRIFDGATGTELYVDSTHGSHTRLEMVVIADCDNDGNAEVVVPENGSNNGNPGVEVWGDAADNWVFTRRIWNQHSYHVTNISETGVVPVYEQPNWSFPHLNNFRQNVQGEGLFLAPDLVIINLHAVCEIDLSVYITFDIRNIGDRMVPDGVAISMYANGELIDTLRTTRALLPGQLEHFSYSWPLPDILMDVPFTLRVVADDVGDGTGEHNECENGGEDNNGAELTEVRCGAPT